jgi:hypothetical protein
MLTREIALGLALQTTMLVTAASAGRPGPQQVDPACASTAGYSVGQTATFHAANVLGADGPMSFATYVASDGYVVTVTTYRYQTSDRVAEAIDDLERVANVESVTAQGDERRLVIRPGVCGRTRGYKIIRAVGVSFAVIAAQDLPHALDVECLLFRQPTN